MKKKMCGITITMITPYILPFFTGKCRGNRIRRETPDSAT